MWGKNRNAISAGRHDIHSNASRMSPQLVISFWALEDFPPISKSLEWKSSAFGETRALNMELTLNCKLSQLNRSLILLLGYISC